MPVAGSGPAQANAGRPARTSGRPAGSDPAARRTRLTFNEERELASLPARIEALEARIGEIHRRFADPLLYRDAADEAKALPSELAQAERDLAEAFGRWEALEARKGAAGSA
jgi:ATP-binding cassette subfamily F protein uup